MKEDAVAEQISKLGLHKLNPNHLDIYIDHHRIRMWDHGRCLYRHIESELLDRIINATQFDYALFCLLRGTFDLDAKDALLMSLS